MRVANDTADAAETGSLLVLQLTIAQRVPLSIYLSIVTLVGLLGNGTVFYSSVRYDAIRLDRVSVILVQNLAAADILYIISNILPQAVTCLAGKWILGPVYCFINAQIAFIPGSANALTVLLITSYRLWLVTHPFSAVSELKVMIIAILTWMLATAGTVISLVYKSSSTFNPSNGKCMSSVYENAEAGPLFKFAVAVIIMMPLLVITIENIFLCAIAVRTSRRFQGQVNNKINFKALVMVCALSGLFILSWVPYVIYTFMKSKNPDISQSLDLLAFNCISINAFVNPILYTLTNKRFGMYVKNLLQGFFSCGTKIDSGNNLGTSSNNPVATKSTSGAAKETPEVTSTCERKCESNA